jgi:hypothetical protein
MTGRRPLPVAAIVAITVVAVLVGVAILVAAVIAFVVVDLAPANRPRFTASDVGPSCSVSGRDVEVRYPIASSDQPYTVYNAPRVLPDHLSGLEYIAVNTDPSSPPDDQPSPQEPQYRNLKVTGDSTVILQLRLRGRTGSADGLRFDWADGEPSYTQTLPLTLRVTASGCTVH